MITFFVGLISCSPDMPENEATFAITPGGVSDAKEWESVGMTQRILNTMTVLLSNIYVIDISFFNLLYLDVGWKYWNVYLWCLRFVWYNVSYLLKIRKKIQNNMYCDERSRKSQWTAVKTDCDRGTSRRSPSGHSSNTRALEHLASETRAIC